MEDGERSQWEARGLRSQPRKRQRGDALQDHTPIDEALAAGARDRAVALLVERYQDALLRMCTARCGTAAEDVSQMIFEQAYRDIGSLQPKVSPQAWLFGIARHRCADHLRSQISTRRHLITVDERVLEESPDSAPWSGVNRTLDEPARLRLLASMLDLLPVRVSFAIVLRHLEGFTYPEMADLCGEAPETLRQRVERGLSSLQNLAQSLPRRS